MSETPVAVSGSSLAPVELPSFNGPLDLLLHLIQKNKVSIYDIPVARICDQYHAFLTEMTELDIEIAGEFIWMASWLVQLKSRMLLPRVIEDEHDPRAELVERLLEYRKIKEAAAVLAERQSVRRTLWPAHIARVVENDEDPGLDWEDIDLEVLAQTYQAVMVRFSEEHPPPLDIHPLKYSLEEKMLAVQELVWNTGLVQLLKHIHSRVELEEAVTVIVAALELARLGAVRTEQRRTFSEIYLRPGSRQVDPKLIGEDTGGESDDA